MVGNFMFEMMYLTNICGQIQETGSSPEVGGETTEVARNISLNTTAPTSLDQIVEHFSCTPGLPPPPLTGFLYLASLPRRSGRLGLLLGHSVGRIILTVLLVLPTKFAFFLS